MGLGLLGLSGGSLLLGTLWLLGFVIGSLLGRLLGWLLFGRFRFRFLGGQFNGASYALAFRVLEVSIGQSTLKGDLDETGNLFGVIAHFVVGHDVLDNSLAAGALFILQSGNSGGGHHLVRGVGSRGLGFGSLLGLRSSGS